MKPYWQVVLEGIWKSFNPILTAAVTGSAMALTVVFADPQHVDWSHVWPLASAGAVAGIVNLYRNKPGSNKDDAGSNPR